MCYPCLIVFYPMIETVLDSIHQSRVFGEKLGSLCRPGDVICLHGELGAGKTTLTQFIATGMGIDSEEFITSPTFSLFHQYRGPLKLNHMDFYRLTSSDDVLAMGLDEYFYQDGVTVIEWYRKAHDIIPPDHLLIELFWLDDTKRKLRCSSDSHHWNSRLEQLFNDSVF